MRYLIIFILFFLFSSCVNQEIQCGDLLLNYGEKPSKLEFVDCKEENGQIILSSKYRVSGLYAVEVETFLIEKYGLGKLKFTCCGWESEDGKTGEIKNKNIQMVNKNYSLIVSMYANAEKESKTDSVYIETDRNKIDFFYVNVELVEI